VPRIYTPFDRPGVDRSTPGNVPPDVDSSVSSSVQVPPEASSSRAPRAAWEARVRPDGSVVIPASLISPIMGAVVGWWREQTQGIAEQRATVGDPETERALVSGGSAVPSKPTRRSRKRVPPSTAALMTLEDFAATVGFSKRKVEQFVAEGMPTVGDYRSRRVLVTEAQEWVIQRLRDDQSEVVHRARADARGRRTG
jgi:hypothetical protein